MEWTFIGPLIILVVAGLLIMRYIHRKLIRSAEIILEQATRLAEDMDELDSDVAEIREQIRMLSNTLYDIQGDADDIEYEIRTKHEENEFEKE